jgi:hypothetical protein
LRKHEEKEPIAVQIVVEEMAMWRRALALICS